MQKRTIAYKSQLGECKIIATTSVQEIKSALLKFLTSQDLLNEQKYYHAEDDTGLLNNIVEKKSDKNVAIETFYLIYSPQNVNIGIIGCIIDPNFNCSHRIICYLSSEYAKTDLSYDAIQGFINYTFDNNYLEDALFVIFDERINADILKYVSQFKLNSTNHLNHDRQHMVIYKLSRYDWGLKLLSDIFISENHELLPMVYDLANLNMERARRLWYAYFSNGVALCNGGVESSIFTFSHIMNSPNFQKYNMYPVDRPESIQLKPLAVLNFLIEEKLLAEHTKNGDVFTSFCLGSHEGFTRIARCIMNPGLNDGFFFPACGYGFSATAAATLKPLPYKFSLIDCDLSTGEKIILPKLRFLLIKNPTYRTLFIELKTTAGAVYTKSEVLKIIRLCKQYNCFIIFDCAHLNMNFHKDNDFPFTANMCLEEDYHNFAVLYTGSKTYGFERGRIGFIAISGRNTLLQQKISEDYKTIFGTVSDIHYEITHSLMRITKDSRFQYIKSQNEKHRKNMNLMIAYIEGVNSQMIDNDLKAFIYTEIPLAFQHGIPGLQVMYKPSGAIQLKITMQELKDMYIANIKLFNSEIFCYALNKLVGVVTLNAFQVMDPEGYSLRLSFSVCQDVHEGMKRIHYFVSKLTTNPSFNPFTPEINSLDEFIKSKQNQIKIVKEKTRISSELLPQFFRDYRNALRKQLPSYVDVSSAALDDAIIKAATKIQRSVRKFLLCKPRIPSGTIAQKPVKSKF